jgi:hypothetical protein
VVDHGADGPGAVAGLVLREAEHFHAIRKERGVALLRPQPAPLDLDQPGDDTRRDRPLGADLLLHPGQHLGRGQCLDAREQIVRHVRLDHAVRTRQVRLFA